MLEARKNIRAIFQAYAVNSCSAVIITFGQPLLMRQLRAHSLHMLLSRLKCYWNRWCRELVADAQEGTLLDVPRKDADSGNIEPHVFDHPDVPDLSGIETFVHFTKSQLCGSIDCILSAIRIPPSPVLSREHVGIPAQASDCFIQPHCITRLQDNPSLANAIPGQSNAFGEHDVFAEKNRVLHKFWHPNSFLL